MCWYKYAFFFLTKSLKTNLICSFLKWLINALSFFTRLHICVYQTAYFNSGTYGQCNHHIFPINETEKRNCELQQKAIFILKDKWYNHQKCSKISQFFTGLLVPYKQVKVSQTLWMKEDERLSKLKHLYSMCKEVMLDTNEIMHSPVVYKPRIVFNQNNAYFNSRISRVSNTKHFS